MTTESNSRKAQRNGTDSRVVSRLHQRRDGRDARQPRREIELTYSVTLEELAHARAQVQAIEAQPREDCRVFFVVTDFSGTIISVDEAIDRLLHQPACALATLKLVDLIAGPERTIFTDRVQGLLAAPEGSEWETRIAIPGSMFGVPVGITIERSRGCFLNWHLRDLTALRRAQARVMQLEQIAYTF